MAAIEFYQKKAFYASVSVWIDGPFDSSDGIHLPLIAGEPISRGKKMD